MSRVLRTLLRGLCSSIVLWTLSLTPVEAQPFFFPTKPFPFAGKAVIDTLILQQAGRPDAIRKIGFATAAGDSVGINLISFQVAGPANAQMPNALRVTFYNTLDAIMSVYDTDQAASESIFNIPSSTSVLGSSVIFAPSPGWHTLVFEDRNVTADIYVSYQLIVSEK